MNRREFLKAAAAMGVALCLPVEKLATVCDSVIDQVWTETLKNPILFNVSWRGTLTNVDAYWPETRADYYGVNPVVRSMEDIDELIIISDRAGERIEYFADAQGDPCPDWEVYLKKLDRQRWPALFEYMTAWLNGYLDEFEGEEATQRGYGGEGWAKMFFEDDFDLQDLFNIEIVEGDCPGSSYMAAELGMDVEQANALAAAHDLPIRFRS